MRLVHQQWANWAYMMGNCPSMKGLRQGRHAQQRGQIAPPSTDDGATRTTVGDMGLWEMHAYRGPRTLVKKPIRDFSEVATPDGAMEGGRAKRNHNVGKDGQNPEPAKSMRTKGRTPSPHIQITEVLTNGLPGEHPKHPTTPERGCTESMQSWLIYQGGLPKDAGPNVIDTVRRGPAIPNRRTKVMYITQHVEGGGTNQAHQLTHH